MATLTDRLDDTQRRMREHIERICERIGPRPACSDAEQRCAAYLRDAWSEQAQEVGVEPFTCHPDAYPATFRWPIALFVLSLCLYALVPALSLLCSVGAVLILVCNLILNRELIDPLFPRRSSANVYAKFPPRGPADRTVVFGCHHDAHHAFPILNRFGARFSHFMTVVVVSNVLLLSVALCRVALPGWSPGAVWHAFQAVSPPLLLLLTATVPLQLYVFLRVLSDEPVLGANDNLSGVAVCLALGEHLSGPENRPRRTMVWLASFGCEEIGIRGSKRFVERHRHELREAIVLNLDMVGGKGTRLQAVTCEEKTLIPLSAAVVHLVREAARRAGVVVRTGPILAFTDAMAFARRKIQATSLVALDDDGIVDTYHSLADTPEHLDDDLLLDCYRLCVAFLEHVDAPWLPDGGILGEDRAILAPVREDPPSEAEPGPDAPRPRGSGDEPG